MEISWTEISIKQIYTNLEGFHTDQNCVKAIEEFPYCIDTYQYTWIHTIIHEYIFMKI